MKKNAILTAISLLTLLLPLPGTANNAATESTARPDIWVYRGYYAMFEAGRASLETSELEELRGAFLSGNQRDAAVLDAGNPLSGRLDVCDIFVLDDTALYFEDAELPVGGLYGFCGITIESGSLGAAAVSTAGDLFIAPGARLNVAGEINAGGAVECFGGVIGADAVSAGSIWIDSSQAPLTLTVTGNVFTGFYTQTGGDVTIGGGLYCQKFGERYDGALITVNCDYARFGASYLSVRGDVLAMGGYGGVEIGVRTGGLDEAALRTFEVERSRRKSMQRGAYEEFGINSCVTFIVGGELRSAGSVAFFEGIG